LFRVSVDSLFCNVHIDRRSLVELQGSLSAGRSPRSGQPPGTT
jgi:hypothetical protein